MDEKAKDILKKRMREATMKGVFLELSLIFVIIAMLITANSESETENIKIALVLAFFIVLAVANLSYLVKMQIRAKLAIDNNRFSIHKETCSSKLVRYRRRYSDNYVTYIDAFGKEKYVTCADEEYSKIHEGSDVYVLHRDFPMYLETEKDYLV